MPKVKPMEKRIEDLVGAHKIQARKNIDTDQYMCGMFNGLELALAIMEDRAADFKEAEVNPNPVICPKCNKDIAAYLAKYMAVLPAGTKMGGVLCPTPGCMKSYTIANTAPPTKLYMPSKKIIK
jgi:hypothetical protein